MKITKEEARAVLDALKNRQLSFPAAKPLVKKFEKNFAKYIGVKYAVTTNNGTSALFSAFFAADIKGKEVLVPSYTWHSTVLPIIHNGGIPVFCDIDPKTLNISPDDIKAKITKDTKAICIVHMWGNPCDMEPIMQIASDNGLLVIEDCSHAIGSTYDGKKVGSFGDIACFSLQDSKVLSAGEGGIMTTDNAEIYDRALLIGQFGRLEDLNSPSEYSYSGLGYKFRPHPLGIAIADIQLKYIDIKNRKRNQIRDYLSSKIKDIKGLSLPSSKEGAYRGAFYGYRIILDDLVLPHKQNIIEELKNLGVPAFDEFYRPVHTLPVITDYFSLKKTKLPVTEDIVRRLIGINIEDDIDVKEIERYASVIRNTFSKYLKNKLDFEITLDCNASCEFCYQRKWVKTHAQLNLGLIKEILEKNNIEEILITGGEPLIYPEITEILKHLEEKKIFFTILTNGKALDNNMIEILNSSKNIKSICFSLDGDEKQHNRIRGEEAYQKVMSAIDILTCPKHINSVMLEDNLESIKDLVRFANAKDIPIIVQPNEIYTEKELEESKNILTSVLGCCPEIFINIGAQETYLKVMHNIKELKEYVLKNSLRCSFQPAWIADDYEHTDKNCMISCSAHSEKALRIDPEGNIIWCRIIRHILGNINQSTKENILNSENYKKIIDALTAKNFTPLCMKCPKHIRHCN